MSTPRMYKLRILYNKWIQISHNVPDIDYFFLFLFFCLRCYKYLCHFTIPEILSDISIPVSSENTFSLLQAKSIVSTIIWISASIPHSITWCLSCVRATDNSIISCSLFVQLARNSSRVWWIDSFSVTKKWAPGECSAVHLACSWS